MCYGLIFYFEDRPQIDRVRRQIFFAAVEMASFRFAEHLRAD